LIPLLVGATIAVGLALGWSFLIVIMLYALLAVAY